jgi:hypothetical protein
MKKMMIKQLVLAKYKTVEEMAVLAKSLTVSAHHEAATEVVGRLQDLISSFKDELAGALEDLTKELSFTQKELSQLESDSGMVRRSGLAQAEASEAQPESELTVSAPTETVTVDLAAPTAPEEVKA